MAFRNDAHTFNLFAVSLPSTSDFYHLVFCDWYEFKEAILTQGPRGNDLVMENHRFTSRGGVRNRRELDIDMSEEELHLQKRQTKPIVSKDG
jgi:hypothetical protein